MRTTTLILAAVFALVGGGGTFAAIATTRPAQPDPMTEVVVATRAIEMGATLRTTDLMLRSVRGADAPSDAATDIDAVRGRYLTAPVAAGEAVRSSRTSDQPPGSRLAQVIPDGRVAISVAVSDVISTGGQIAVGDRVDVLGVVTREATDIASVVLTNVPVIAVSNAIAGADTPVATATPSRASSARTSSNPKGLDTTITLAVTVAEAQHLVQVDEVGKLRLALRPRTDGGAAAFR
jgi:pilus assembly protein CpaB